MAKIPKESFDMRSEVEILPYDSSWPRFFEEQAEKIKQNLGENCIVVHHVGSTAVPGLCAKPKIDIILVVKNTVPLAQCLENLGYQYRGEFNIPFRLFFSKRDILPGVNLHVYEQGNFEIELNILFRDFLRDHSAAREEYALLKLNLATQASFPEKHNDNVSQFNLGKDAFIKQILNQAGFKGICMRICTHHDEWKAAHSFRQKYFFDKIPVIDPYTWTFNHQNHIHLILYQGTKIVGYSHIQLWKAQRAALRIIAIDEPSRGQGLGSYFLKLCERWLKQKGFKKLQTQSFPEAYEFYGKHGYNEMHFNDPDGEQGYPQGIDLGKIL